MGGDKTNEQNLKKPGKNRDFNQSDKSNKDFVYVFIFFAETTL
jgi:hypothetical protein